MKLYIVRHGQTGYNIDNKVCGISDVELTSLGKQQAKMASEQLKEISLDMIFASPLQRAHETAKIINKAIGYGADKEYIDKNTNTMTTFDDVDRTNPYYYEILVATNTISYQRTENLRIWRAHVTQNGTWSDSNFGNGDVISPIK